MAKNLAGNIEAMRQNLIEREKDIYRFLVLWKDAEQLLETAKTLEFPTERIAEMEQKLADAKLEYEKMLTDFNNDKQKFGSLLLSINAWRN